MKPPKTIDVRNQHGGFTAVTTNRTGPIGSGNTLWRPGRVLRRGTIGILIDFKKNSFYQNDNNVTMARYRVPGYPYPVMCWFSNVDGRRIA